MRKLLQIGKIVVLSKYEFGFLYLSVRMSICSMVKKNKSKVYQKHSALVPFSADTYNSIRFLSADPMNEKSVSLWCDAKEGCANGRERTC